MGKLFIAEFAAPINDALPAPPRATQQVEIGPAAVRSKPFTQGTQRIRIHSDEPCLVFFRDDESERLPADTDRVYAVTPGASIAVMQSDEAGFGGSASTIEGLLAVLSDPKKYSGLLADLQTKAADARQAAGDAGHAIAEAKERAASVAEAEADLQRREKALADGEADLTRRRQALSGDRDAFDEECKRRTKETDDARDVLRRDHITASDELDKREKAVASREVIADRREKSGAEREAALTKRENEVQALQAEYERKIANLREALG